jgi:hypothetical protein
MGLPDLAMIVSINLLKVSEEKKKTYAIREEKEVVRCIYDEIVDTYHVYHMGVEVTQGGANACCGVA